MEEELLKKKLKSMENAYNTNIQTLKQLKTEIDSITTVLFQKQNYIKHCEEKCTELKSNREDILWKQIKARTVLKTDQQFSNEYESTLAEPNQMANVRESNTDFLQHKIMELKMNKETLNKQLADNDEKVEDLNNELRQIKN